MENNTPNLISKLADSLEGTLHEVGTLPDGSGFATMSFALREDHWLYETTPEGYTPNPSYPLLAGKDSKARDFLTRLVEQGARYGVKAATMNGREDDFDPDALVRNVQNGLFGLHTDTGLSRTPEDARLFDPPQPGHLGKVLLEALSLALHDGLLTPESVTQAISTQGVAEALERHQARAEQREREYQELAQRNGWERLLSSEACAGSLDK